MEKEMKTLAKLVLGGLMLTAAAATAAPANAGVAVGVNIGVPGVAVGYGYGNPCYRPYAYRPAYCRYPVYGGPLFVNGGWYREPIYYRYEGGARFFWLHNGWVRDRDDFHRGGHDGDGRGWHDRDGYDRDGHDGDRR
jgi:hypothetical protein